MSSSWNLNRVLVLLGAALTIVALGLMIGGAGAPVAEMAPFFLGPVAAVVLAFYAPRWMYLVAGILGSLFPLVVVFVFGAFNAIIHPGIGVEGAAVTLVLLAAIVSLLGGIMGFVQAKRTPPAAADMTRAPQGVAAIALAALFIGVILANGWAGADHRLIATAPATLVDADRTLTLHTTGAAFAPRALELNAGELTAIHIVNGDPIAHTFTYHMDGVERTTLIPPESEMDIWFRVPAGTTIHFWCAPHSAGASDTSEDGMWGTLTAA